MAADPAERPRIAIIKLGSLGDVVQALGPFRAIRAHHPDAALTLITTPPYADLARATGYFDDVWPDGRPRRFSDLWGLIARLRRARFRRIYDLQTSTRTSTYHALLWPRLPEWSGVALGCSHPHDNPQRVEMHTIDRQAEQLRRAGVEPLPPELGWADRSIDRFGLARAFALIVPGGSAHRPAKRWPAAQYALIARHCAARGLEPVVIGGALERPLAAAIAAGEPRTRDLTGATDFLDILALGRHATLAVGNDTGPMHLIAVAGAPALVLFSAESDPARCAPRGPRVAVCRREDLATLGADTVSAALDALVRG